MFINQFQKGSNEDTDGSWLNRRVKTRVSDATRPDTVEMSKGCDISMSQLTDEITSQSQGFQDYISPQHSWNQGKGGIHAKGRQVPHVSVPPVSSKFHFLKTPTRSTLKDISSNQTANILSTIYTTKKRKSVVRPWLKSKILDQKPQMQGFTSRSTRPLSLLHIPSEKSKNSASSQDSNCQSSNSNALYDFSNSNTEIFSKSYEQSLVSTSQSSSENNKPEAKAKKRIVYTNPTTLRTQIDKIEEEKWSNGVRVEIAKAKEGALSDIKAEFAKMKAEILDLKSTQSQNLDEVKAAAIAEITEAKNTQTRYIREVCDKGISEVKRTKEEAVNQVATTRECNICEMTEKAAEIKTQTENTLKVSLGNLRTSFLHSIFPLLQEKALSILSVFPACLDKNVNRGGTSISSNPFTGSGMEPFAETLGQGPSPICQSNPAAITGELNGHTLSPLHVNTGEAGQEKRGGLTQRWALKSESKLTRIARNTLGCVQSSINIPAKFHNQVTPQPSETRKRSIPYDVGSADVKVFSPKTPDPKRLKHSRDGKEIHKGKIAPPIRRSKRIEKIEKRKKVNKRIKIKSQHPSTPNLAIPSVAVKRGRRPKKKIGTKKQENIIEDCFDFSAFRSYNC